MSGFRLKGRQFKILKQALITDFQVNELEDLLLDITDDGIFLDQIISPTGALMEDIARHVIKTAERDAWMLEFIEKAHQQRSTNNELTQLYEEIKPQIQASHSDPLAACCLSSNLIMLNRDDLRNELGELNQGNKRVLVIDGQPFSGKTYSEQLIYHLRDWPNNDFKTITCDLLDLEKALYIAAGSHVRKKEISADLLGSDIFSRIPTSQPLPARGELSEPQWNLQFTHWLMREFNEIETLYWIIIDHFNKVLLSQGAYDFIKYLVRYIHSDITCLRLVLMEYKFLDELGSLIPNPIGNETIPSVSDEDLFDFFETEYVIRSQTTEKQYTEQQVAGSVARVWKNIDRQASSWMRQLSDAVVAERKDIQERKV